eukprot:TRINITY_DN4845_c0_g1_i1.p1 TRINITY_DN4845_c0_g1~~TRINITY_DN4845_c0_g1_i1.p1  ORF type:complete len:222 (-),score=44.30 TRINITY_DN4845_c0_g1_i1:226-891(-)
MEGFNITIRSMDGQAFNINVNEETTQNDLRGLIQILTDLPPETQRLVFDGLELNSLSTTMSETRIVENSLIRLVAHLAPNRSNCLSDAEYRTNGMKISEITPNCGPVEGGNSVIIEGEFDTTIGALSVCFGNVTVPCKTLSSKKVKVIAPSHSPGVVTIKIVKEGAFSDNSVSYTYLMVSPAETKIAVPSSSCNPSLVRGVFAWDACKETIPTNTTSHIAK